MRFIKLLLALSLSFLWFFSVWGASVYNTEVNDPEVIGGYENLKWNDKFTIADNIWNLFSPDTANVNVLWEQLRIALVGLFIVMIVRWGVLFILWADNEESVKKARMNLLYTFYGGLLIFGVTWLLWDVLQVWNLSATIEDTVSWAQNDIIGKILLFFKSFAYFISIVMVAYYWFQIIRATDQEEMIKKWRTWLLNVVIALFSIKILDYLYYIAQESDFENSANKLINEISQVLWWIAGIMLTWAVLYAVFILISSRGKDESWQKAKTILRNAFITVIVVFFFIIIIHNVLGRFT